MVLTADIELVRSAFQTGVESARQQGRAIAARLKQGPTIRSTYQATPDSGRRAQRPGGKSGALQGAGLNRRRRAGAKGERSIERAARSRISSAIASPVAGAFRMPQTLWPVATYAPSTPAIAPISGSPSAVTGR